MKIGPKILFLLCCYGLFSLTANAQHDAHQQGAGPLTWENLESELDHWAEENAIDGAVLITRDGEIALNKGWGKSNREKEFSNGPDTIFAIGSCPIDFTHAGILLLKDRGKLDLNDPITKFFDNVPDDKKSITIRHLMTGASGLPDFHDVPTDENPDHSWIDRDEAVRRIFGQKLLFEPGKGNEHSHSAWGLLAAIIEIASDQSYQDFSRENLYKPAGMVDTGFFGEPIDEKRVAVGYGFRKSSEPNSPPNWGKTSWLVMGSGGQVSTLADIYRWEIAICDRKILSPESTELYLGKGGGVSADGDMFGFEFVHSHNPESLFMLISNSMDARSKRRSFDEMGRNLYRLTNPPQPPAPYTMGIAMGVSDEGIFITQVMESSAAEEAGLQVGDQLLSAGGIELVDDPTGALRKNLTDGTPIEFKIRRGEEELSITLKPRLRDK